MAKNPTRWSNNDVKPSTRWANNDIKNASSWSNNDIKNRSAWANNDIKNPTTWGLELNTSGPWLYDSATQKYDDTPVRGYDFLVPISNTLNGKWPTPWSQVV